MTPPTNSLSSLPREVQWQILSFNEPQDYIELREVDRNFNCIINEIALRSLNNLEQKFLSISEKKRYLYLGSASDKSFASLFYKIFSLLKKEISSMPDGEEFLKELQKRMTIPNDSINAYEETNQILEGIRDKNFIIICKEFKISALDTLIGNITNAELSEKANRARTWILNEENRNSLLEKISLNINYLKLTELSPEIRQMRALEKLDLDSNLLYFLPPEIGQLTALQELELRFNQLITLPPQIGQLTALRRLNLQDNQLTSLPPQIGQLTALQELFLENNQLIALPPEIGQLTIVQYLRLNNNQLTSLPPQIGQLTALQMLYLSGNQLTSLPKEIGQLTNLQRLYLRDNQLISLPEQIGQCLGLQELHLDNNQLTSLPSQIRQLNALYLLNFPNNQFISMPKEIKQLTGLQSFNFENNPFNANACIRKNSLSLFLVR